MSGSLYTLDILRLAAASGAIDRLDAFDVSAERRSQVCGSSMVVDLQLADGRIVAVGGRPRACAFGQASAALFVQSASGRTLAEIEEARAGLAAWLDDENAAVPTWPGIEVLAPARRKPARHAAILLPFDAALAALASHRASA